MSNTTLQEIAIPKEAATFAFVCSVIIIILGIIGNSITILGLTKGSKLLSQPTTKFVINLAITDLLFCTFNLPLTSVRYLTRSWPFGSFLCRLYPFFFYGNVATSLMSITCITINRLVLITLNRYYKKIYTKTNVWLMIVFCWAFSFSIISMPLFEIWGKFGPKKLTFSCTILKGSNGGSPKKFLFTLGFALPITVIIICYTIIWIHVKRETQHKTVTSKRDLRLTKLICVIFGAFVVCIAPLTIVNVFVSEERYPYLHVTAAILAWFNACVNPILYFVMNTKYRTAFKNILRVGSLSSASNGGESLTSDHNYNSIRKRSLK